MIRFFKNIFASLKAWYRWKFKGYVAAPRYSGGQGTSWQEHQVSALGLRFPCACGNLLMFTSADYFIRSQDHEKASVEDRELGVCMTGKCHCPVTNARYVMICPQCRLGHWMNAKSIAILPRSTRRSLRDKAREKLSEFERKYPW